MVLRIPSELESTLRGYDLIPDTMGRSGDGVYRLEAACRPTLFIKVSERTHENRLVAEAHRVAWLSSAGIQAPRILRTVETADQHWLVMECLPGANAVLSTDSPAVKVQQVAKALADLHSLPPADCPFDETLAIKLERAKQNIRNGEVDVEDFDHDHRGMTAPELYCAMESLQPGHEDIVVAHGDASLPNFMLDGGAFAGFVDCGRLGRSDRYQDLSLACHSIEYSIGADWVAPFLRRYGLATVDERKLRFYRMLDEFF